MLPDIFQAMKSSFHPTELPSSATFVSLSANPKILPYAYTLLDTSLIPIKYPTGFIGSQPIHALTSAYIRDPSIFLDIQPSIDPGHVPL